MDTTAAANRTQSREATRLLAQRIRGLDAHAAAEATINTWTQLDSLLAPIIGAQGMNAIFRRALYLTSKDFPWLACDEEYGDYLALLASLKARMEEQCADDIAEAGYSLLGCFTELLTILIGEVLTERLLAPVWEEIES